MKMGKDELRATTELFEELNKEDRDPNIIEQDETLRRKISTLTEEDLKMVFTI